MDFSNLLTPWLALAAVLYPLAYAERWIHSHLYGVGWLLTNEPRSATALYYLFLSPGVFVHEVVQWLVAGALNIETERVMAWPEAQEDGTLRLNFVQVKNAGRLATAIVGAAPLIVGLGLIAAISTTILDLDTFLDAVQSADIRVIGPAARELASTADFYLWLYLMFAIANAMLPTQEERSGWLIAVGLFAVVLAFLVIIGVGDVLVETFTGPVAHAVNLLTTAFGTILAVEVGAILVIGLVEQILERITRRRFDYSTAEPEQAIREPGSNLPLAPGEPFPSIYNLSLPLPDPAIQADLDARKRRATAPAPRPFAPESRPAREPGLTSAPAPSDTLPRRESAPSPGEIPRRDLPGGMRPAPGMAEGRRAPTAAQSVEPRVQLPPTPGVPSRREPSAAPVRPLPGDRPAPERPARPTEAAPSARAERPATGPFASRPLPGAPTASDRARPPAPGGSPFKAPDSAPRRPLDADKGGAPERVPTTPADTGDDDEVEYVDFDDL